MIAGLLKLVHILAVVIWVGGMFFAYMVLRCAAAEALPPPERLRLWDKVLARFFNWVWLAVIMLLASGFYMIYLLGGFAQVPFYILLMALLGIVMTVIFLYVFFVCFKRFSRQVEAQDWRKSGTFLVAIRKLVGLNLVFGLFAIGCVKLGEGWVTHDKNVIVHFLKDESAFKIRYYFVVSEGLPFFKLV